MKVFNVCFIIFLFLYLVTLFWFDDNMPFKPLTWLIIKLAFAAFMITGMIVIRLGQDYSKLSIIFYLCIQCIFVAYFLGYKQILKYKIQTNALNYGLAFNPTRKTLGTPIIPVNWSNEIKYDGDIMWSKGKKDAFGHMSKLIDLDTVSKIESEDDSYYLKKANNVSRRLLISSYYKNNIRLDSVIFYYSEGSDGHNITRQQADSILTAEKIEKDY